MDSEPDMDQQGASQSTWYPTLLWASFFLVVCGLCLLNYYDIKRSAPGIDNAQAEERASTQMMLIGRYSMGAKSIYSGMPGNHSDLLSANMLLQIKSAVQLKTDQVGLIPFIAEFAGTEEVFHYINELREDPDLSLDLTSDLDQFENLYRFGADSLSGEVHQRLIHRHRWFAKMALTYGLPSDHPERVSAMAPAKRTFISAFIVMGLVFIGGIAGLVLFIVSMVMVVKKRLRFAIASEHAPVPEKPYVFLETTVFFLSTVLLMAIVGRFVPKSVFWCLYIVLMYTALFWPVCRGMGFKPMRKAIGWHKGAGVIREAAAGFLGYLAGLPVVGFGCLITIWIINNTGANPVHPIVHQFDNATIFSIVVLIVLASIIAPILEETIFRGALYRHLRFKHSAFLSSLTSGFLFAVIHPQGFAAVPVLGAIGMVFAALREWRGSLIAPMTAHALNNFLVTMLLVFALMG